MQRKVYKMSEDAVSVIRAIRDIDNTVDKLSGSVVDLQKFIAKVEIKTKEFVSQLQSEEIQIYISMSKYQNIMLQMQLALAENEKFLAANINNSTKVIQQHYRKRKGGGKSTTRDIDINRKTVSRCTHSVDEASLINSNNVNDDAIKNFFSEMSQDVLPYKQRLADLKSKFRQLRQTTDPDYQLAMDLFDNKEIETQTESCACSKVKVTRSTSPQTFRSCNSDDSLNTSKYDENINSEFVISKKYNEHETQKEISDDRNNQQEHIITEHDQLGPSNTLNSKIDDKQDKTQQLITSKTSISVGTEKLNTKDSSTQTSNSDPKQLKDTQNSKSKQTNHINKAQEFLNDKNNLSKSLKLKDIQNEIKHKRADPSSNLKTTTNHNPKTKSQSELTKTENRKALDKSGQRESNKSKDYKRSSDLQTSKTRESNKSPNIEIKNISNKSTQKEPNVSKVYKDLKTSKLCDRSNLTHIESEKTSQTTSQKQHSQPKDYSHSKNLNTCKTGKQPEHPKVSSNHTDTQKQYVSRKVCLQKTNMFRQSKNSNSLKETLESASNTFECSNQNINRLPDFTDVEKKDSSHKIENKKCCGSKNTLESNHLQPLKTIKRLENNSDRSHLTNTQKICTSQKDVYMKTDILEKNKDRVNLNTSKDPDSQKNHNHNGPLKLIYDVVPKKPKKPNDNEVFTQLQDSKDYKSYENKIKGPTKIGTPKNYLHHKQVEIVSPQDQVQRSETRVSNELSNPTESQIAISHKESVGVIEDIPLYVNKLEYNKQYQSNNLKQTSKVIGCKNNVTDLQFNQTEPSKPNYNKYSTNLDTQNSIDYNIGNYGQEFIKQEYDFEAILNSNHSDNDSDSTLILEEKHIPSSSDLELVDIKQDLPSLEVASLQPSYASHNGNITDTAKLLKTFSDPKLNKKVPVVVLENLELCDVKCTTTNIETNTTVAEWDIISLNNTNEENINNPVPKENHDYLLRCRERLAKDYNINMSGTTATTPKKKSASKNTSQSKRSVSKSKSNNARRRPRSRSLSSRNKRVRFDITNSCGQSTVIMPMTNSSNFPNLITYVPIINLDALSGGYQMFSNNNSLLQSQSINSNAQTNLPSFLPPQNLLKPPNEATCNVTVNDITQSNVSINQQTPVNPIYKFNAQEEEKKKSNTTAFKYHAVNESLLYLPPDIRANKRFMFNDEVTSIRREKSNPLRNTDSQRNNDSMNNKLAFPKEIEHVCIPRLFEKTETNNQATSVMKQSETVITQHITNTPNNNVYSRDPRMYSKGYKGIEVTQSNCVTHQQRGRNLNHSKQNNGNVHM